MKWSKLWPSPNRTVWRRKGEGGMIKVKWFRILQNMKNNHLQGWNMISALRIASLESFKIKSTDSYNFYFIQKKSKNVFVETFHNVWKIFRRKRSTLVVNLTAKSCGLLIILCFQVWGNYSNLAISTNWSIIWGSYHGVWLEGFTELNW